MPKKKLTAGVSVKVLINSLGEDDDTYAKGETLETTAERAAALGDSVEILTAPKAPEEKKD